MKAAVIERPGVMNVREVPDPVAGEYDCVCQMLYGATCSATDLHMIEGALPFPIPYPTIFGHESVGRIIRVGKRVRHLKVGDLISRVGARDYPDGSLHANWGGFAQLGIARDHRAMREDNCSKADWDGCRVHQVIPAGIDPRAACMIITWRETLSYALRRGVGSGMRVLVIGSGGNGLAFAAHARNLGAAQVALIGSPAREQEGLRAGAGHYLSYRSEKLAEELAAICPDGFDVILDSVGKSGAVNAVLGTLKSGGLVAVYGIDDFDSYGINPLKARGLVRMHGCGDYDEEEAHEMVVRFIREKKLEAEIWLDLEHPFALADIADAMAAVRDRRLVKALVKLSD